MSKLTDILDEELGAGEVILLQRLLEKCLRKAKSFQNPEYWAEQEKKFIEALKSLNLSMDENDPEMDKVVKRFKRNAEFSEPYFELTRPIWELKKACSFITGREDLEGNVRRVRK